MFVQTLQGYIHLVCMDYGIKIPFSATPVTNSHHTVNNCQKTLCLCSIVANYASPQRETICHQHHRVRIVGSSFLKLSVTFNQPPAEKMFPLGCRPVGTVRCIKHQLERSSLWLHVVMFLGLGTRTKCSRLFDSLT